MATLSCRKRISPHGHAGSAERRIRGILKSAGSVRRGELKKTMPSDVVEVRRAIEAYVDVVESITLTPEDSWRG
jgi:hypothetical protein